MIKDWTGLERDWLAACFGGSLCIFFGSIWLYKELLFWGWLINFSFLPAWTSTIIYLSYNTGNAFFNWWYFSVLWFQLFTGVGTMYLYCWLKKEMETRAREEHIKPEMGKLTFKREVFSVTAMPCAHKLWDQQMDEVVKRYNNMHEIDVRANILCPKCKNRIDYLCE